MKRISECDEHYNVNETELMMQINNSNFNQNEASSVCWSNASAYTQLKANDSIVPSNYDLVIFKESVDLASLGKFTEIDNSLTDTLGTNIDSLKSVNNSISSNNVIEDLLKELNGIKMDYLKYKAITALQMNQLRTIAALCPFEEGPAVYTARALLRGIDTLRNEYMHECEKVYPNYPSVRQSSNSISNNYSSIDQFDISINPNPTKGIVNINHNGLYSNLTIEETNGKVVFNLALNQQEKTEQIDVTALANGLYIIKISNSKEVKVIKLVVNK